MNVHDKFRLEHRVVPRPDAAFALLSPSSVIFPRHSAQQWAQGDRRTAPKAAYVNKAILVLVSNGNLSGWNDGKMMILDG